MVLQHVLERSDAVVVPGSTLQRQRFVPDDVDPGDMGTIPDRLEDAIGKPRPEDVLDGCHREEVVDAKDRLLGIEGGEKAVELDRFAQALAERLLQHDDAAPSGARTMQGRYSSGEDERWKRQVRRQWFATLGHGGHARRIRDVRLMVARDGRHGTLRRCGKLPRVPVELGQRPSPERLVGPVLPADRDEPKVVAQLTGSAQGGECRQKVARGEVAGCSKYGQLLNHALNLRARASVTPLAITPMWLNA